MKRPAHKPMQLSLFEQETVSISWAAKYLNVSTVTIMRYREQGMLRGYQFMKGGWWRIVRSSIEELQAKLQSGMDGDKA